MPGAAPSRPAPYAHYDEDAPPAADAAAQAQREGGAQSGEQEGKGKEEGGKAEGKGKGKGGWLGGILTKLSLRPPNQMILPDDSNPTIVWDAEHKRWRNLDQDGDDTPRPPPPPPARSAPPAQSAPQSGAPSGAQGGGAPPVANIFKMQKGRHIKKSYVDVFNPSGAATRPLPPAAEVLGAPPPAALAPPTYFVPAPIAAQVLHSLTIVVNFDFPFHKI
ncbi:PREDICTED: protein transport protein Sec16A-like [Papilio xuthus]|uniref:Protein transport protein Sec16A-like n=1 Tax=Papilio xuthus TaxID=66420 RepID=A0AAJ6Z7T9_PAPXU|nr:PREDICTED: protein transport protein Sec16A-like [Papilio xuthus]